MEIIKIVYKIIKYINVIYNMEIIKIVLITFKKIYIFEIK